MAFLHQQCQVLLGTKDYIMIRKISFIFPLFNADFCHVGSTMLPVQERHDALEAYLMQHFSVNQYTIQARCIAPLVVWLSQRIRAGVGQDDMGHVPGMKKVKQAVQAGCRGRDACH